MSYNPNIKFVDAETYEQRLERMYSYFDHLPTFIEKGKYMNKDPRNNVQAIRGRPEGSSYIIKEWFFGHNIVTADGRIYYAIKAVGGTPAANENFGQSTSNMQLSNPTAANTPADTNTWDQFDSAVAGNNAVGTGAAISQSIKDFTSGYPKVNDTGDPDNTGDGVNVVSYAVLWQTTDFNDTQGGGSTIKNGCIHDNNSPVNATKLLTHWAFGTAFAKTSNDTLKVFVNHTVGSS